MASAHVLRVRSRTTISVHCTEIFGSVKNPIKVHMIGKHKIPDSVILRTLPAKQGRSMLHA
eukprot:6189314-Pleurochrysis_carterae.AAC.1